MKYMDTHHLASWIALAILLILLIYALRAIKREKWSYEQTGKTISFGPLALFIPGWWSETRHSPFKIEFTRTDTRYDWKATFEWYAAQKARIEVLLQVAGIAYDDELVRTENDFHFFKDDELRKRIKSCVRLEGRATQLQEERVYLDLFLIDFGDTQLVAWNQSSVLTGVVEGPYFEEVMLRLKLIDLQFSSE